MTIFDVKNHLKPLHIHLSLVSILRKSPIQNRTKILILKFKQKTHKTKPKQKIKINK